MPGVKAQVSALPSCERRFLFSNGCPEGPGPEAPQPGPASPSEMLTCSRRLRRVRNCATATCLLGGERRKVFHPAGRWKFLSAGKRRPSDLERHGARRTASLVRTHCRNQARVARPFWPVSDLVVTPLSGRQPFCGFSLNRSHVSSRVRTTAFRCFTISRGNHGLAQCKVMLACLPKRIPSSPKGPVHRTGLQKRSICRSQELPRTPMEHGRSGTVPLNMTIVFFRTVRSTKAMPHMHE